jgi:16S rRNA (cytosine967-C5)-methyltransferase
LLRDAWAVAIETLSWMEMQKLSERLALARTIKQLGTNNTSAIRYAYGLVVETTRCKNLLDKFVNSVVAPKRIGEYNLGIQSFLRLYIYQTRVLKNWTKINLKEAESIASLGRSILGWQIMRDVEPFLGFLLTCDMEPILKETSDLERVSLQTYNPLWFVKYCYKLFGRDQAIALLESSLNPPPTYIRVNTLVGCEETALEKLGSEGVKLEKTCSIPYTYKIGELKKPLNTLLSFKEGLFYIQDKASCFAAQVANPQRGNLVFDVCAAPGAKTTLLAQLMKNEGHIFSIDFSARRMKTWQKETLRMGTKITDSVIADACSPFPFIGEADLVVLDPPCTSTGVFAKQPSSKWRLNPNSIEKMAEIQLQMINNCAKKVTSGGILTYSTCSITEEENEMVIERFLNGNQEFDLSEITPAIGLPGLRGLSKCQRLYPHIHQCNGFFIAKLKKQ